MVLGGLASGTLAAIAGNQAWAVAEAGGGSAEAAFATAAARTDASAPPVTALALVVLATWGVVLVSRGWPRRVVTWLGLLAAVGVIGFAVAAWLGAPESFADGGLSQDLAATRTAWSYLGVVAGLAGVITSALAVRSVRQWPEMGRRYDAPGDEQPAGRSDVPLEEQTNLDLWRAIDEGRDPTEESTH